jgi:hypothetical protein
MQKPNRDTIREFSDRDDYLGIALNIGRFVSSDNAILTEELKYNSDLIIDSRNRSNEQRYGLTSYELGKLVAGRLSTVEDLDLATRYGRDEGGGSTPVSNYAIPPKGGPGLEALMS